MVIGPDDPGYDITRKVHNGMIDKRPAVIARCTGVADVMAALQFGIEHDLPIAVRGGGHNVAGKAVCDDGIVIDLSPMKGMRVDPARRLAQAQAGLTWGEFDRETQAFGLATTGGAVSTTGIAGLTLGGGIGWLQRKYGLTCDNLLSADVVTRRRSFPDRERQRERRPVLGTARRRRQLRHRDVLLGDHSTGQAFLYVSAEAWVSDQFRLLGACSSLVAVPLRDRRPICQRCAAGARVTPQFTRYGRR